jgi:hypothetical protein
MTPEEVDGLWAQDEASHAAALRLGMQKYVDQFKYYNSFAPLSAEINCIDEGLPGGYHLAGAGILLGVDDAAKAAKKVRASKVHWHSGCGAAEEFVRQNHLDPAGVDEVAQRFATELARLLGVAATKRELERPSIHIARIAYVCLRAKGFDYRGSGRASNLLPGFIVDADLHPSLDSAIDEARLALDVSLSEKGFGHRFTPETPFILSPVASDGQSNSLAVRRLQEIARVYGKRVKIDGFSLPG